MAAGDDGAIRAVGAAEDDVSGSAERSLLKELGGSGEGHSAVEDAAADKAADGGARAGALDAAEDVRQGELQGAPVVAEGEAPREDAGGDPGHSACDHRACVEGAAPAGEGGVDGRVAGCGPGVVEVAPVDDLAGGAAGYYGCAAEEVVVVIIIIFIIVTDVVAGWRVGNLVKVLPR